jgi:hypothetical protein
MDTSIKFSAKVIRSHSGESEYNQGRKIARLKAQGISHNDAITAINRGDYNMAKNNPKAYKHKIKSQQAKQQRTKIQNKKANKANGYVVESGGDPHFKVALPTGEVVRYDVHGDVNEWHNLVSIPGRKDGERFVPGLRINGFFEEGSNIAQTVNPGSTWITGLRLVQGSNIIRFSLDGSAPSISYGRDEETETLRSGETYKLEGGISLKWDEKRASLTIDTPDATFTMKASGWRHVLGMGYLSKNSGIQLKNENAAAGWHGLWAQMLDQEHRLEAYGDEAFQNGDLGVDAQGGGSVEVVSSAGDKVVLSRHGDKKAHKPYVTSGPDSRDDDFAQESVAYVNGLLEIWDTGTAEQRRDIESKIGELIDALPLDKQPAAQAELFIRGIELKEAAEEPQLALAY